MCKAAIGQANINAQEFQNIGIYIPPIELQRDFASFKDQVDKSKFLLIKARKVFVDTNNTKMRFDYFTIIVIIGLGKET